MGKKAALFAIVVLFVIANIALVYYLTVETPSEFLDKWLNGYTPAKYPANSTPQEKAFLDKLVEAAIERTKLDIEYDPAYFQIDYPGGDVPADKGVCTDVVIRSYRKLGIDLQKEVHDDMDENFGIYPKIWGLKKTDTNIDHRRVPNLMVFFGRKGTTLPITDNADDYCAGDLVTWDMGGGRTHIGIVVGKESIVHNRGAGVKRENKLFNWKVTGHFRYYGPGAKGENENSK